MHLADDTVVSSANIVIIGSASYDLVTETISKLDLDRVSLYTTDGEILPAGFVYGRGDISEGVRYLSYRVKYPLKLVT